MMRTIVRSIVVLAIAAGLVGACGASAGPTQAPSLAATPADPTATPAPPDPTSTPTVAATPVKSVEPMASAYVTGTASISETNPGTTVAEGDCTRVSGVVVQGTSTMNDPRVSGTSTAQIGGILCGPVGFEWITSMQVENADGAWEGPCTGGMWANANASNIGCWLVGSGAYKGLTYYMHGRNTGDSATVDGVILPAAPPPLAP
jgi:hypothetical protein